MKLLTAEFLQDQKIDLKMAAYLREIGEHKGRAELYGIYVLDAMESLRMVSAEYSAVAACRLERSNTSVEQANYQRVLLEIQDSALKLPLEANRMITIQAGLFRDSGCEPGGFKSAIAVDEVDELCRDYLELETTVEPLLLMGAFVIEFLRIQPFVTANLRMTLLIASWLMNRQGFTVGRFVSLERVLETKKNEFQDRVLLASSDAGCASFDLLPRWSCWLELILLSYRELSARAGALGGRRGAKTDIVLALIDSVQGDFSIRHIQQHAPECGIELIRKIFKEQKAAGKIKCTGRGPNALWRKKKSRIASVV
jgi:hypothetical protein